MHTYSMKSGGISLIKRKGTLPFSTANNYSCSKLNRATSRLHSTASAYEDDEPYSRRHTYKLDSHSGNRPIYVAATKEHVGKTTTCVALIAGLKKRFPASIGYLKPVGQRHVPVYSESAGCEIRVDKDVALIREHYKLDHLDYKHMSPVLIPKDYTKDYIDGKISHDDQLNTILDAVENITRENEVVLCEGTGHCAVGSIIGASNAKIAGLIGADMVLVANGGIGSCFDEIELNRNLCQHHNVNIAGVIINKVIPEKYEQTKHYMTHALKQNWNVPLLGCIPDFPFLGCPALADLERLFDTSLITGEDKRFTHYTIEDISLVATSLGGFLNNLRTKPSRTLYICHVTRDDIILGFLAEYQRKKRKGETFEAALVICGREGKYHLDQELLDMIQSAQGDDEVPILPCPHNTTVAMEMIRKLTPKLNSSDVGRLNAAVEHYEAFIDYEMLLNRTRNIANTEFGG